MILKAPCSKLVPPSVPLTDEGNTLMKVMNKMTQSLGGVRGTTGALISSPR